MDQVLNGYTIRTMPSGATIELWTATCRDCGFVTGMASVRFPDGSGATRTGAGCRSRRGLTEALTWALTVAR